MKKLFVCCFLLLTLFGEAQTTVSSPSSKPTPLSLPPLDQSPMDMAYYPNNYPLLKIQDKVAEPLVARVIYSRPQKNGRTIFGGLIEYGKVWRLGANEATEIELYRDVKIKDKKLAKGRYTMYAIPTEAQWTIIFNKDTDIWGAFKYDDKKDVLRVDVPVQKHTDTTEAFTILFNKTNAGADMVFSWDDVLVTLPLAFNNKP